MAYIKNRFYKVGFRLEAAAAATTALAQITVRQELGPATAIDFWTSSTTLADVSEVFVTVQVNNEIILDGISLIEFISDYQRGNTSFPIFALPGGTIDISFQNDSANQVDINITLLYDYGLRQMKNNLELPARPGHTMTAPQLSIPGR